MYFLYVNKTEYTCTVCYLPCWAADSWGCLLVLGVCEFWTNQGVVGEGPDVDGCMTCGKRKRHMYRHRAGDTSEDQRRRGCYHGDYRVWVKEVNISEACFKCFCQSHCLNELIADSILVTSSVSTCTTYSGLSWCVNVCRCWKSLKDLRESKWTECYSTRRLPLNLSSWWSTGGPRCSLSSVGFQFCHCALSSVSLMVPPISITNSGFYSLTVAHAKSFFVFLLALQVRGSHSFRPQSMQTSTRACTLHLIST